MTASSILEDEVFVEVFEEENEIVRARLLLTLIDRAKDLGVKAKFEKLVNAYKKVATTIEKDNKGKQRLTQTSFDNYTQFGNDYEDFYCGNWVADFNGIRTFTMFGEKLACYHPIIPIQRLINAETGKEKIKLAFIKGENWKEIIVDKGVIASSNRIVSLADYGISVTSESAKSLVQFLSDVENYNIHMIEKVVSTSKLGWIQGEFMPYMGNVVFDNEIRFKETFESIQQVGSSQIWFDLVKSIRNTKRIEPYIYIIASLASPLIELLNALPFIVNLWGDTGKGKTVVMMLAASVWAYPGGNDYITDPKATATALELRMDFLNNLPMLIDDMAQLKERYNGDFSELIYLLCSGKGKDRANANLGLNKATSWKNAILTNGEHSLITQTMQGGAVNRVIDIEMGEGYIFEDGNHVVEVIKQNYGFAGNMFIDVIKSVGISAIKEIQQGFVQRIKDRAKELGLEKEEKQIIPMSILLTTDKLATEYLFNDKGYLDFNYCVDLLKNKGEVSENERAYEFIMSEISINASKFRPDIHGEYKGEVWGLIDDKYVYILNNAFNRICERGNFSSKSFLSWAAKKGLIEQQSGKNSKNIRVNGSQSRCICLKLQEEETEFTKIEDEQIQLPFE